MNLNIIGGGLATIVGVFVAFLNYFLSKTVLVKMPDKYSFVTVIRQVFQIGFLALVYFIGDRIDKLNSVYLLVGAVVGMTVPMLFFTKKLLSINSNFSKTKTWEGDENG